MTDHLPECPLLEPCSADIPQHGFCSRQNTICIHCDQNTICIHCERECICDRLRACEQRCDEKRHAEVRAWSELSRDNFDDGFAAGLDAARELARGPVIGVAEAAMRNACYLATGFSVVTTLQRTVIIAEHLVHKYGVSSHCRKVRASELAVLELEDPESNAYKTILDERRKALDEDGSGAIVLGCAGMADL